MEPVRLVRALGASPRRGACTDAERRAAVLVHDALRGGGHQAWIETEWVRPQWAAALALGLALALAGSLVSVSAPVVGAALAGAAALALAIEAAGRAGPLRWAFPRRATQTVVVEPLDPDAIALLVCARTDVGRGGLVRRPALRALARRVPGTPRGWIAGFAVAIVATAAARVAGTEGTLLGVVQFVPTVALLLALAAVVDVALSPVRAGTADAAAVAAAVTLHAELVRSPPGELSPGLVLHGAGEGDPLALRRLLRRDGRRPADTVVVTIEPVGEGEPEYAAAHAQLRRAAEAGPGRPAGRPRSRLRLPLIAIGAPGDAPDAAAIDAVVDQALATVDALDAELSA